MRILVVILVVLALLMPPGAMAAEPNNLYGIHLAVVSREDLKSAAALVNGHGGAWGYVTVVIQDNDRDIRKWQEVFDTMREERLIPIVRLATHPDGSNWHRPQSEDVHAWIDFLSRLNWVVKNRYIVLFNEPNHATEWGGAVDPEDYGRIAYTFAKSLHQNNADYVVMLAGMDAAAPAAPPQYADESIFMRSVLAAAPDIYTYIDGLSSHSYPNPGFSGSPYDEGRNTIHTYDWELGLLKALGVTRDLPVYITETGWTRQGNMDAKFTAAYSSWSRDPRVRAATPFLLNYQAEPFLNFSWQKPNSHDFYSYYYTIEDSPKTQGRPEKREAGSIQSDLPDNLTVDSTYHFSLNIKNRGQAIWDARDGYELRIDSVDKSGPEYFFSDLTDVRPLTDDTADLYIKIKKPTEPQDTTISLYHDNEKILTMTTWKYAVVPLPRLVAQVSLFPRIRPKSERSFELQIFDSHEQLVYKKANLHRFNGNLIADNIHNIYLGGRYRVVVLTDLYLPRQTFVTIRGGENHTSFKPMLPFDLNSNGHLDIGDIWSLITNPLRVGLLLP